MYSCIIIITLYLITFVAVFEHFEDTFAKKIAAQAIAKKLYDKKIIPQRILNQIKKADDDYEAASFLYNFMKEQGDYNSARMLFEVMIGATGYKQMSDLGEEMLNYLQTSMF